MTDVPLYQHWKDIYARRGLILLTAVAAAGAAWVFSILVTPVHEAKATFYLAANATAARYVAPLPDAPPAPLFPVPEEKAASLDVGILRGREIRGRLAQQFGVEVGDIARKVDVTVSGEFMIDVFARDPDPSRAADMANAVADFYADFHKASMRERALGVVNALTQRQSELLSERSAIQQRLFDSRQGTLSTADAAALSQLQAERDTAQREMEGLASQIRQSEARLASLDLSLTREGEAYANARTVLTTAALDRMQERVLDLRVELAGISEGPTGPRRRAIEGQINEIEAAMQIERKRLSEADAKPWGSLHEELRLEQSMTRATIAGLAAAREASVARLDAVTARFNEVLGATRLSDDAAVELERINQQLTVVADNLSAARLQAENAAPAIVIVEQAVAPTRPAFPLVTLNVIVAFLSGLVFGTYYALFLAHSERGTLILRNRTAALPMFNAEELAQLRARFGGGKDGGPERGMGHA